MLFEDEGCFRWEHTNTTYESSNVGWKETEVLWWGFEGEVLIEPWWPCLKDNDIAIVWGDAGVESEWRGLGIVYKIKV